VTAEEPIHIFLSHDVDWGKKGAPIPHILARKERFEESVLADLEERNPYQNIPEILEIEERHGLKSTFFFRTRIDSRHPPPPYDLWEYESDIRTMVTDGWEIGLHSDHHSTTDPESLLEEKKTLEEVAKTKILGNRTHYTVNEEVHVTLIKNLESAEIMYDSSVKFDRERITVKDCGCFWSGGVVVFPISLMDALIFSKLSDERDVLKSVKRGVEVCRGLPSRRVLTLLWHNCSLKMKFGRKYSEVVEYLASNEDLIVKTGKELATIFRGD